MSSAMCFNLDQSKILLSGNGLKDINLHVAQLMIPDIVKKEKMMAFSPFYAPTLMD